MSKSQERSLAGALAFVSLLISAVLMIICFINNSGWITIGGKVISILQLVSYLSLVVVVVLTGWTYAKTLTKTWRIIYLVIAVLALLGALGFLGIKIV